MLMMRARVTTRRPYPVQGLERPDSGLTRAGVAAPRECDQRHRGSRAGHFGPHYPVSGPGSGAGIGSAREGTVQLLPNNARARRARR
jgi:hypothetical protein